MNLFRTLPTEYDFMEDSEYVKTVCNGASNCTDGWSGNDVDDHWQKDDDRQDWRRKFLTFKRLGDRIKNVPYSVLTDTPES